MYWVVGTLNFEQVVKKIRYIHTQFEIMSLQNLLVDSCPGGFFRRYEMLLGT